VGKLTINVDRSADGLVALRLKGLFEGLDAIEAAPLLEKHLELARGALAVVLSEIEYIDSAAVGVLIELARKAAAKGLRMRVVDAQPAVRKVLEVTKVDRIFPVE